MILMLLLAIGVAVGVMFLSYWPMYGAPYVPTQKEEVETLIKKIGLKKGQIFCDLGCGDGRMAFAANKLVGCRTIGVDINWGLIQWCKFKSIITQNKLTEFVCRNFMKEPMPTADVYYLYLWPTMLEPVRKKIRAVNKRAVIISKSFAIKSLRETRRWEINNSRFWVYETPRGLKSERH